MKNGDEIPVDQRWWLDDPTYLNDTGAEHDIRTITYARQLGPSEWQYAIVRRWDFADTSPIDVILCSKGEATWHPLT